MVSQEEVFVIHDLHRQGLSIRAIAERTGLSPKTVRRYVRTGLKPPRYKPREAKVGLLDRFREYLAGRLRTYPELSAVRLLREIRARGYQGGYTIVKDLVRELRPAQPSGFERRFETPPGRQAQVDFAHFKTIFTDEPSQVRVLWLFTFILGWSRWLFGRFVLRQTLETFLRCHLQAFAALGGVPEEILYDRMKTVVLGEDEEGRTLFHPTLLDCAQHFDFRPRACQPYRAQTKGKIERPYRYIRQDFFLGRDFRNLADLNEQFAAWLAEVANQRNHGTTRRCIAEALAEEQSHLRPSPEIPYGTVLRLERRLTRDGMVSVDSNLYSVPDTTRRRVVEVQALADEIRIYEAGQLVAIHAPLEGRHQSRVAAGHRILPPPANAKRRREACPEASLEAPGVEVGRRPLEVYETIGSALATMGRIER